jgi:hypothetical protein
MTTQAEALDMIESWDHAFVTPAGAVEVCGALGIPAPSPQVRIANPQDFKGLTVWDDEGNELPPGTEVQGHDAEILAAHCCKSLGVDYGSRSGRGSQLRACVRALRGHFGA